VFRKRRALLERRMYVEQLIDNNGVQLYKFALANTNHVDLADVLWLESFLFFYRTTNRWQAGRDDYARLQQILFNIRAEHIEQSKNAVSAEESHGNPSPGSSWASVDNGPVASESGKGATTVFIQTRDEEAFAPELSEVLRMKVSRVLWAAEAMLEAQQHVRGARWITFATVVVTLLSCTAILYGASERFGSKWFPVQPRTATATRESTLPTPLQNLPVTTLAQISLAGVSDPIDAQHAAIQGGILYVPRLSYTSGNWPHLSLATYGLEGLNGSAGAAPLKTYSLNMVPPMTNANQTNGRVGGVWSVAGWRIDVAGHYAVITMNWHQTDAKSVTVTQLYGLELQTGNFGLMKTLVPQAGVSTDYVCTVGDDKVVIQAGVTSKGVGGVVGLPIDVYTFAGTDPGHAMQEVSQLPGTFGVMSRPTVTTTGIVFQGILGKPDTDKLTNATWYELYWSGSLTKLVGPPVDGQPHDVVQGVSGALWWVETTPATSSVVKSYQVLMSPLIANSSKESVPALTLSGTVESFTVTGRDIIWTQDTNQKRQMVITQVQ